jgi:hypothetical protein
VALVRSLVLLVGALACGAACGRAELAADARPVDPDDRDGDGVPNLADDCPEAANPDQHDEDGDGVGDACDDCPTVADPSQRDLTEVAAGLFPDGVGDACDLRPALGGDRIAALYTFADPASAVRWSGAGWTIAGDAAHAVPATPATDVAAWASVGHVVGDGAMVQARFASVSWQRPGASVAVTVDGDGVASGARCAIFADRDGDGFDELEGAELGGAVASHSLGVAISPGTAVTVTSWRSVDPKRVARHTCRVAIDGVPGAPIQVIVILTDDATPGTAALTATGAGADVGSVIVYASPILPSGK